MTVKRFSNKLHHSRR